MDVVELRREEEAVWRVKGGLTLLSRVSWSAIDASVYPARRMSPLDLSQHLVVLSIPPFLLSSHATGLRPLTMVR